MTKPVNLKQINNIEDIVKGDNFEFYVSFEDMDIINSYDLDVLFITDVSTNNITITATKDLNNNKYIISRTTTQTNSLIVGDYKVFFLLKAVDEQYTINSFLAIKVLNSAITSTYTKSHNQKVLDALKSTIEGKASYDQMSYAFNGINITRLPIKDLIYWKNYYETLVKQEKAEEDKKAGNKYTKLNKIKVKF